MPSPTDHALLTHALAGIDAVSRSVEEQDRQTYREVHEAVTAGREVARDFRTGAIVPESLRGRLYSQRDLHASAFAEIDARVAGALVPKAREQVARRPERRAV